MNEEQLKLLKESVTAAYLDTKVPLYIYEQLINLLDSAMGSEEFVLFLDALRAKD